MIRAQVCFAAGAAVAIAVLGCSDKSPPGMDHGTGGMRNIDSDLGGAGGGGGAGTGGSGSGGSGLVFEACPTQSPVPVGAACSGWSSCTMGTQTCCSHTEPVTAVSCTAGKITTQAWETGCQLGFRCVEPLGVCGTSGLECGATSTCVPGCAASGESNGVCSVPGRETCGCGATVQPCTTPGLTCLMPSCCDHQGLCVTADERRTVCSGPMASRFDCARDAGAD